MLPITAVGLSTKSVFYGCDTMGNFMQVNYQKRVGVQIIIYGYNVGLYFGPEAIITQLGLSGYCDF